MLRAATCLSMVLSLGLCAEPAAPKEAKTPDPGVFFDDFSYGELGALAKSGWTIRTQKGWPGIAGARWGTESFALLEDPAQPGNRVLRMIAETDGTSAGTHQAQLCQARKYFEGTYAARVRFEDKPVSGPACDDVVQSFYTVCPLEHDFNPKYSELDFEYLPRGGWNEPGPTMDNTSWETVRIEPWKAFNEHSVHLGSLDGWHVLVLQVSGGKVGYFVDGKRIAEHGGKNYPRVPMSINFNLWFIRDGVGKDTAKRVWNEEIDWAFYAKDQLLSPADVAAAVGKYRKAGVAYTDTVPAANPPLPCPCDM
jgi:hypothetical protein